MKLVLFETPSIAVGSPIITLAMAIGGAVLPKTAFEAILESLSNTTSLSSHMTTSQAKRTPSANTTASISRGPNDTFGFLLNAATTLPAESLITATTPDAFS